MKACFKLRCTSTRVLLVSAALILQTLGVSAQIVTLSDGNSSAQIDPGSPAGMFNWLVQGQNYLQQQWFWYRLGTDPQHSIDSISAPAISTYNGTRGLTSTYDNGSYRVRIDYLLSGGSVVPAGQNANADISESITIVNETANPLNFHFFQYSDFNLSAGNDTVQLGHNLAGLWNEAAQSAPNVGISETVNTPGANRAEVGFVGPGGTRDNLNNIPGYNLNNNGGPLGPGNVTWALQWDFNLNPGSSFTISKDKSLNVTVTPEPSAVALLGVGFAGLLLRRNRARA
jgi:PEP-CTERM motif